MMRALATSSTGMKAQETNIDVISNNIANINTTAFKRQRAEFSDLIYQSETRPGPASSDAGTVIPTGIEIGLGVKLTSIYRIPEQGSLIQTFGEKDMAVQGRGFFRVIMPDGSFSYTRDGSFEYSPNKEFVTKDGYTVSPGITVPQDAIKVDINSQGQVYATLPNNPIPQLLGQFDLVDFLNTEGLEAMGGNLFTETAASGAPIVSLPGTDELGTILQGWLEGSNVNPVTEMTSLITAQRSYELNSKVIQSCDEMLQTVNQIKR